MILNLTLDDQLAQRAQQMAESMGISLDQLIRSYLENLVVEPTAEQDMAELRQLSGRGDSQAWRFDRDEIHECS